MRFFKRFHAVLQFTFERGSGQIRANNHGRTALLSITSSARQSSGACLHFVFLFLPPNVLDYFIARKALDRSAKNFQQP
ncbi:MAG: hypothetical protein ACLPPF_01620, partial [Rhodomicrobium sp.]